jgi:hypothetical protein
MAAIKGIQCNNKHSSIEIKYCDLINSTLSALFKSRFTYLCKGPAVNVTFYSSNNILICSFYFLNFKCLSLCSCLLLVLLIS